MAYIYDATLTPTLLPPELLIKKFVYNDPNCDYEKYLLEFINASAYFLEKSKGECYKKPLSEESAQCDCNSSSYQLDFKLFASETLLHASSILPRRKALIAPGVTASQPPKEKNGFIEASLIYSILRDYDFEGLRDLRCCETRKQGITNDICTLLKKMETPKNLLLFLPYKFSFEKEYSFLDGVDQIRNALNNDFQYIMQYRSFMTNDRFDTYMAFIYDGRIVFMVKNGVYLDYIDSVNLNKSKIFMELSSYSN